MTELLEIARQHVIDGRKIVERQRALVDRLRKGGHNTQDAARTLDMFERSLAIFEEHLSIIERLE